MTALFLPRRDAAPASPSPRRLLAGALVGGAGAVAFSVAVGSFVVGSSHRFQPATAVEAGSLVASVPWFVVFGFVHLAVAAALAIGGRRVRVAAVVLTAVAVVGAFGWAILLLTGIDPSAAAWAGHPSTDGVAIRLLAAGVYAAALAVSDPGSTAA